MVCTFYDHRAACTTFTLMVKQDIKYWRQVRKAMQLSSDGVTLVESYPFLVVKQLKLSSL